MMKTAMAAFILRVKILSYTLLFSLQRFMVRAARLLPGSWTVLRIPRWEIDDVKTWVAEKLREGKTFGAEANLPRYLSFGSPSQVPRRNKLPPELDRVHPQLQQENIEFRQPFLVSLPSGLLLGPNGCVITPDGGIVTQSIWTRGLFEQDRIFRSLRLPEPQFLPGSYYTIASPYSSGYYHWVVEVLPRLFAYESVAKDRPRLVVNSPLNRWQLESLKLLGFPDEDLVELGTDYLQLEKLYFPAYIGINPYCLDWIRERLFATVAPEPTPKRIYITRRLATKRRLINENEIDSVLQQHGFIIAELETLSFVEQVQLFSQAEIVVAPHGAGLTNMVWGPRNCKVMEIHHPDYLNFMYYMLAEVLHQRYWCCVGTPAGDDSVRHGGTHGHGDLTISVDLFTDTLSRMLEA
ncbi:MAG TPA: glycosyltransferase 61 family protein [Pyrinomonadaceae bacterium]|nr:glycosyltransferase 61 family protein [Pyrinomonadaceae bacterium]